MPNRNKYSQRGRSYTDPTPSRQNSKYHQRGGAKNYRPEPNRRRANGDDVDTLMVSIGRHLTTHGNPSQELSSRGRNQTKSLPPSKKKNDSSTNRIAWWRVTIQKAGEIGKERVMAALQARCARPFQPYHVNIYLFRKFKFLFY
jgi:hypothetical protein